MHWFAYSCSLVLYININSDLLIYNISAIPAFDTKNVLTYDDVAQKRTMYTILWNLLPLCSASKALTSLDLEKFPKTRQASTIASMFSGISKEISTATGFARNMLLVVPWYLIVLLSEGALLYNLLQPQLIK